MNRKEKYDDFDQWEMDVFRAGATQVLEVGDNIFYAIRTADNKPVKTDADGMFDLRSRRGREVMKNAITIGGWAGELGEIYRHLAAKAGKANPASRKENYNDFDEWETDVFRAGATQVIRLGEDLFSAIKMRDGSLVKLDEEGFVDMRSRAGQKVRRESVTVGAWYGDRGEIYRQTIKNNPVTRRKGESIRDFTSRCMSEEKTSFPEPKQRIAVCLSKSRRRNPLESGASISDDEDINRQASRMG